MTYSDRAKTPMRRRDAVELLSDYASSLPESEQKALLLMLSDSATYSINFVTSAIKAEGYPICRDTVSAWRRKHRDL